MNRTKSDALKAYVKMNRLIITIKTVIGPPSTTISARGENMRGHLAKYPTPPGVSGGLQV